MILSSQLHLSKQKTLQNSVFLVENKERVKPKGGLWTSSYRDDGSDWVDWCRSEGYSEPEKHNWFVLEPDPTAVVYVINSLADLKFLLTTGGRQPSLGRMFEYPDFEQIAKHYDAIHLTENGQWATRLTVPNLYGWDCESTLWFNWRFTSVVSILPKTKKEVA